MRHAGHRDALPAAGLFAGQRDLQRARDRFGVLSVGFVEVADAREQDRFGMLCFHPEVLLEHRRILDQRRHRLATPSPPDRAADASRAARDRSSALARRRCVPRSPTRRALDGNVEPRRPRVRIESAGFGATMRHVVERFGRHLLGVFLRVADDQRAHGRADACGRGRRAVTAFWRRAAAAKRSSAISRGTCSQCAAGVPRRIE